MHDETNGPKTLIRPARSASCFPWQAREAAAAAKTRRHQYSAVRSDRPRQQLHRACNSSQVSPHQPWRPWPLSVSCQPAHDTTMQHDHVLYVYTSSFKLLLFQFILFAFVERVISCMDGDGVMGIQSNTYARTFNQPSIPCGCRGQHNTQWNFSVSHTTHTKKASSCIHHAWHHSTCLV